MDIVLDLNIFNGVTISGWAFQDKKSILLFMKMNYNHVHESPAHCYPSTTTILVAGNLLI